MRRALAAIAIGWVLLMAGILREAFRHGRTPEGAAPAISATTLSILVDDSAGGCAWSRVDPMGGASAPVAVLPGSTTSPFPMVDSGCRMVEAQWRPDGREAVLYRVSGGMAWTGIALLVDLTTGRSEPLSGFDGQSFSSLGYSTDGRLHALRHPPADWWSGQVPGTDLVPAVFDGSQWHPEEPTISAWLAGGAGFLRIHPLFPPSIPSTPSDLAALDARWGPDGWKQFRPGFWYATTTGPSSVPSVPIVHRRPDGALEELPGAFDGSGTKQVETRSGWTLVSDERYLTNAHLYDPDGRLAWSSDDDRHVTFWPLPDASPATSGVR